MESDSEELNVLSYNEIINKKNNISINQLENCLFELEKEREIIEKNIDFLWVKVMEPYINYKADLILSKNINNIKLNFYKLLYHNKDIENKIININNIIQDYNLLNSIDRPICISTNIYR
jgi:hypothetical protein